MDIKENTTYNLILGGSSGLGWASACKLASKGNAVIIIHRDSRSFTDEFQQKIKSKNQEGLQLVTFNFDVLNESKRDLFLLQLQEKNCKINLLLHSVSKGNLKPMIGENSLQKSDFEITLHAMGYSLYEWVSALHAVNLFTNPAKVLAFTSLGSSRAMTNYGAVSSAKSVLESVSRNIALEFAKFGITSNCVEAGVCETKSLQLIPNYQKIISQAKRKNPFQRLTTPEDVANVVYLLSLPESKWINGSIIKVDGGESIT
ncbi:MAG: SDR family oxidoreductase [Flavobacteriaceae bacterium]|nr:SDR family oxidoreductase [Flavobacteriaceae bacterium]